MASIGRDLKNIILKHKTVALVYATVNAVDKNANTMSVSIGGEVTIPDISLSVIEGGNANALLYPKLQSIIVLGFVEDRPELSFPVSFSEVDEAVIRFDFGSETPHDSIIANKNEISIVRGNTSLKMDGTTVDINNGHLTIT